MVQSAKNTGGGIPDSDADGQRRVVRALAAQLRRVHRVAEVTTIETHISFVLLAGDTAYKIKKALKLPFVDYSTLALRRHFCDEELRLNRRLAPGLYRDVVAISGTPDRPQLGQQGPVLEYAVRMRAFAQDALLSACLVRGDLPASRIDEFARLVAAFHDGVPRAPADSAYGAPQHVLTDALENFEEIVPHVAPGQRALVDGLLAWTRASFARCDAAMAARHRAGRVRECHGDLHLGNAALVDGRVTVFDCIEFNPDLIWIDVIGEVAFTAMDLANRGRNDYAWRFVNAWLEATGDYGGVAVLRFHLVYRAMVRAKVRFLRAAQLAGADERARIRTEADGYLALARRLAAALAPAIVVMHGASGAGKTTVAQALAETLPAIRLRTDVERKRLLGLRPGTATGSALDEGAYGAEATDRTYAHLCVQAATIVDAGYTALLDGAFLRRWQRDRVRALAAERKLPFVVVDVQAPDALLRQRVAARGREGADASEATLAVLERQLASREALASDERACAVAFDGTIDAADPRFAAALAAVARAMDAVR